MTDIYTPDEWADGYIALKMLIGHLHGAAFPASSDTTLGELARLYANYSGAEPEDMDAAEGDLNAMLKLVDARRFYE